MFFLSFCILLGCDAPVSPQLKAFDRAALVAQDTAPLTYICGNRFRIKNNDADAGELQWEVVGTADRGVLNLPGRAEGIASTTRIVTGKRGDVRLLRNARQIARAENRGVSCLSIAPSVTPKPVWDSITRPENVLINPPSITGRVVRHTLYVRFTDDATLVQKEAALATIGAEVIGGMLLGPARFYHLRLLGSRPLPPDSSSGPLLRAVRVLRALPHVRAVLLDILDRIPVNYVKPADGAGFTSWRLSADSASGVNWRLDAIEGPLGWSCETGSQVDIGLADEGFHDIVDLHNNVGTAERYSTAADTLPEHATWVGSVIAAEGNNQQGITGVMWRARLNAYDAQRVDSTAPNPTWYPVMAVYRAGLANPIVNVSMGLFWLETHQRLPDSTIAGDLERVNNLRTALLSAIGGDLNTLYVFSASNDFVDAWWAGYTAVATDPDTRSHVLIVGGTQLKPNSQPRQELWRETASYKQTGLPRGSNTGSLVDVVAPAGSITTLDRNGDTVTVSGNSMAAPAVAGLAGLLLSMDSTRTATQLRDLIIQGALDGGRSVPDPRRPGVNIPIINVHKTLARAAERPGTPLCGNRVWRANDQIVAERGNQIEVLATIPDLTTVAALHVHHGGRRFDVYPNRIFEYQQATSTWTSSTGDIDIPDATWNGTFSGSSWYVSDHDNRNVYYAEAAWNDDSTAQVLAVQRRDVATWTQNGSATLSVPKTKPLSVCERRDPEADECLLWGPDGTWQEIQFVGGGGGVRVAISSVDSNIVWVAANWGHYQVQHASPAPCSDNPDYECRAATWNDSSAYANVYRMNMYSNTWQLVPLDTAAATVLPARQISWLAVSETGAELLLQEGLRRRMANSFQPCTHSALTFRALQASATVPVGRVHRTVTFPDEDSCITAPETGPQARLAEGTMAPALRAPGSSAKPNRSAKPIRPRSARSLPRFRLPSLP